jgi:hypothetical protein
MATVRIQVRRGTASQWTSANPILAAGELGVESDTNLFKFGNGSTTWTALAYANNSDVAIGEISQDAINTALTMGDGLTKTYDDGANTITITVDSTVARLSSPTFTGTVVLPAVTAGGSIIPSTDNVYDLGSPTKMWKDIYVGPGSLYVNGQKVIQDESGAIVVSADINENLGLRTSGSGNIELDPTGTGSVNIKGPVVVEAGANFSSNDGNGITFSNAIKADSVSSNTLNTDLSLSGNGTGKVYLNDNAEINGNLAVVGNLNVGGTVTTINSETISLADNIIDLNSNFTTGAPTENSGVRVIRGDEANVQVRWNETADKWQFTNDGSVFFNIAPAESPTFTGVPEAPTAAADTNTTQIATTAFAKAEADAAQAAAEETAASALSSHSSDTTDVHGITDTSILVTTTGTQTLIAKSLTSPALTGTPTAPTASAGTDTTQVATTAFVQDAIELVVGAAPAALNTLAEIATSLADNADLSGTLTTSISNKLDKAGDTMSGALNMGTNKITNLGAPTINSDAANKAYTDGTVDNYIINHAAITTSIHGISDTANLVYTSDTRLSDLRVPQNASVSTEKIVDLNVTTAKLNDSAVTSAKIEDGAVATAELADLAVTTAKIANSAVTSAKINDSAVTSGKIDTGAVTESTIADSAVATAKIANSAVTSAKINDLAVTSLKIDTGAVIEAKLADSSVTSAKIASDAILQSHISDNSVGTDKIVELAVTEAKLAASAVSTGKINNSAITEDKIAGLAVTEGKIADSAVTTVKLADSSVTTGKIANGTIVDADVNSSAAIAMTKIDGLGAALDAKLASATAASTYAPIENPTFTGTVAGVTKAHVGLGNVDNTTDANKPVSTATQTALDLKANKEAPTFTGNANFESNVTIEGNLVVEGTTTTVNTSEVQINDPLFYLAANQYDTNTRDIGITGAYGTVGGTEQNHLHTGLVKDVTDGKWKLFSNTPHPVNNVVDFTSAAYDTLKLGSLEATTVTPSSGVVFSDGTQTKMGVASLTAIKTAVTGNTTLDALGTDANTRDTLVPINGAFNISFEATGNAKYAIGASISFYQASGTGGNITGSGVTILSTPGAILRTTNSSVTATKVAATTWLLAGDLRA